MKALETRKMLNDITHLYPKEPRNTLNQDSGGPFSPGPSRSPPSPRRAHFSAILPAIGRLGRELSILLATRAGIVGKEAGVWGWLWQACCLSSQSSYWVIAGSSKMAAVATCGTGAGSTGSIAAAASKNNVSSFQRKGPRASGTDSGCSRLVSIAGTRPSVRNGQLLVSTGLPALDQLLGRFRTESWAQQRENLGRAPAREAALTSYFSLTPQPSDLERIVWSDRDGGEEKLHGDS